MPEIKFTKTERKFVRQEIRNLKEKEVLVEATHVAEEYISNIFLREKREPGKYRMILNLKHLNKFVDKKHFKMDTLQTTLALVTPGCTFMSFDFSDAYYSCSVFPPHRKYLRFMFEGQLYEFTCLPNGLSTAPRFFTKIMKVALAHLHEKGEVTISGYLDDNIPVNYGSTELAIKKGILSADTLQELGFTINIPKSVITAVTVKFRSSSFNWWWLTTWTYSKRGKFNLRSIWPWRSRSIAPPTKKKKKKQRKKKQ